MVDKLNMLPMSQINLPYLHHSFASLVPFGAKPDEISCNFCAITGSVAVFVRRLDTIRGMQSVLVVDDDPHIREVVCFALEQAGFTTFTATDGVQAIEQHRLHNPDLVVLDVLMPELDGLAVCTELRRISSVPIVILSSRDEEVDRIVGLDMGADDYIGKPFSPRELVARVKANLRRQSQPTGAGEPANLVRLDEFEINLDTFEATWRDSLLTLTQTEFQLLRTLIGRPDKVFSRDALMQGAYDVRRVVSQRTIDSHIRRLRDKLAQAGAPGIRTVHGIGYRLDRSSLRKDG
jgi:two-component system OmpR family response regulator